MPIKPRRNAADQTRLRILGLLNDGVDVDAVAKKTRRSIPYVERVWHSYKPADDELMPQNPSGVVWYSSGRTYAKPAKPHPARKDGKPPNRIGKARGGRPVSVLTEHAVAALASQIWLTRNEGVKWTCRLAAEVLSEAVGRPVSQQLAWTGIQKAWRHLEATAKAEEQDDFQHVWERLRENLFSAAP